MTYNFFSSPITIVSRQRKLTVSKVPPAEPSDVFSMAEGYRTRSRLGD